MKADREIKVRCSACGHLTRIPTVTNADRIRAMSDEELLNLLCLKHCPTSIDPAFKCKDIGNCKPCWEEWLKQEVDG